MLQLKSLRLHFPRRLLLRTKAKLLARIISAA
jgi:hypothetical protein